MGAGLSSISIRNYGCLKQVENVALAPLTAFVGPNDAGKTMLLRALETVGRSLWEPEGYRRIFPSVAAFLPRTFQSGGGSIAFELTRAADADAFCYAVDLSWANRCQLVSESLTTPAGSLSRRDTSTVIQLPEEVNVGAMNFGTASYPMLNLPALWSSRQQRLLDSPPEALSERVEEAIVVAELLATMQIYALRPEALRRPSPAADPAMHADGFGLASAFAQLLLRRRDVSTKIEKALSEAMPHVSGVNIATGPMPDESGQPGHFIEVVTPQGNTISHDMLSDGVLLYLGYLFLAFGTGSPRIILLEEPETGIHPGLLARLVPLFRSITTGAHGGPPTQILMTTHSPLLVNLLEPEEIRLVQRGQDGATRITPFASNPEIQELLEYQGPGEIWINQGEEFLTRSGRGT